MITNFRVRNWVEWTDLKITWKGLLWTWWWIYCLTIHLLSLNRSSCNDTSQYYFMSAFSTYFLWFHPVWQLGINSHSHDPAKNNKINEIIIVQICKSIYPVACLNTLFLPLWGSRRVRKCSIILGLQGCCPVTFTCTTWEIHLLQKIKLIIIKHLKNEILTSSLSRNEVLFGKLKKRGQKKSVVLKDCLKRDKKMLATSESKLS